MPSSKNKKDQQKAQEVLRVMHFPVHQRDLISGGQIEAVKTVFDFHFDSVLALQAPRRGCKTLFSIGNDNQLKSWSYPNSLHQPEVKGEKNQVAVAGGGASRSDRKFAMELQEIFEYDAPISIAVHPDGHNVVVIFLDRMRFYYACYDCVRQGWELPLKQPSTAQFSNGGDLLAISTMSLILLIDVCGGQPLVLAQYTGHLNLISQILFSEDDKLLMSCGQDGCIYGWEVAGGNRVIEHVNKGSVYLTFCYDMLQEMVVAVSREGDFRMIRKDGTIAFELKDQFYTSLKLAPTKKYLVAGTIYGSVRIFDWPLRPVSTNGTDLSPSNGASQVLPDAAASHLALGPGMRYAHVELLLHTAPVTSIALSSDHTRVFSGDESGAIVCCAIKRRKKKKKAIDLEAPDAQDALLRQNEEDSWERLGGTMSNYVYRIYSHIDKIEQQAKKFFEAQRKIQFPSAIQPSSVLDDYILCSRAYLEDKLHESQELMERIDNVKNDSEYTLAQKDQEVEEKVRQIVADNERTVMEQKERYDMLADKLSQAHHYHADSTLGKAKEVENNMRHVEREQEAKLSKEYEKQNRLLNEIQALREKNRLDLVTLEESYEAQIAALKKHNETAMREWRSEYDKVCAVLKTDGLKFEEALKQQETEYESEIGDFLDQRRHAQQQESEKYYSALRETVSMKNNILALQTQIKQQREDLHRGGKAQEELKRKLEEAVEMFRKVQEQLKERDKVIKVKDETLQKLRSNQKHLESFRYVLFHKVQTLEKERDPLEEQVGQLKDSVQGMYQEMVQDLRKKQALETKNIEKHFKIQNLVAESNVLARNLKATRKDFRNMISDIAELAEPDTGDGTTNGKNDVNHFLSACKEIVGRYQGKAMQHRSAAELNDEEKKTNLPLITNEAIRQRDALVNKSKAMSDTNKHLQNERANDINRLTKDNSDLILEMNRLRHEKTLAERKITDLENSLYSMSSQQTMSTLKKVSIHSSTTPYLDRKKRQDSEQERLDRKREHNQLPPKLGGENAGGGGFTTSSLMQNKSVMTANTSFEREGFNVDRLRENLPLQNSSVDSTDNTIYTGGPIPPANKFPAVRK